MVSLCIQLGTHYVDINGETEFVEKMFVFYNERAKQSKVTIVSCCGFDSVPADMGVVFAREQLEKRGLIPHSAELFLQMHSGKAGAAINFATYESLVESLAHVQELRKLRKDHPRPQPPRVGKKLLLFKNPRYEDKARAWVVPFPGADGFFVLIQLLLLNWASPSCLRGKRRFRFSSQRITLAILLFPFVD